MRRKCFRYISVGVLLFSSTGCRSHQGRREGVGHPVAPASVDESRMLHADQDPGNWMSYGRTYSEQRFSPLKQINDQNVGQLGLAWSTDLVARRGQETDRKSTRLK